MCTYSFVQLYHFVDFCLVWAETTVFSESGAEFNEMTVTTPVLFCLFGEM